MGWLRSYLGRISRSGDVRVGLTAVWPRGVIEVHREWLRLLGARPRSRGLPRSGDAHASRALRPFEAEAGEGRRATPRLLVGRPPLHPLPNPPPSRGRGLCGWVVREVGGGGRLVGGADYGAA